MKTMTLLAMTVAIAFPIDAADPSQEDQRARDVALKWDASDKGFHDSKANISMILEDARGNRAVREMVIYTLESPGLDEGDKSLVIFESPRDVQGTALLTHAHILDSDDQWLYLPALGRIKRISSANKSGPFVGSEFAYEDIAGMEVNKYAHRWLREEPCNNRQCAVLEQIPKYAGTGYSKLIAWYELEDHQLRKIDYYDRRNALMKTLMFQDYRHHHDKFWRAHELRMVNHQTGKKTMLRYDSIEFQTGLEERDFDRSALRRLR